jgi:streptogramin lyase
LCAGLMIGAEKKVTTIAGNGAAGFSDKEINNPYGLSTGPDGAIYICEIGNHVVRRLDLKTGTLQVIAGTPGKKGYAGDGGLATEALLNEPYEVRFDKDGNMFFVEMQNHVVRRVDATTKKISTIVGNGKPGFAGDGGPGHLAQLNQPHSIEFDEEGALLICDIGNNRLRRLCFKRGLIDTLAGTGEKRPTPAQAPLAGTPVNGPRAVAVDSKGTIYLALREGNAIYRIDRKALTIAHFAGTGEKGYSGDGADAKLAKLSGPKGVSLSPDGGLYIADTESHTIRRIDLKTGIITTVLGTGVRGNGDDSDPLKCALSRPHGVFVDPKGLIYVGDSESHKIRLLR